jgi:hypothetical protein
MEVEDLKSKERIPQKYGGYSIASIPESPILHQQFPTDSLKISIYFNSL